MQAQPLSSLVARDPTFSQPFFPLAEGAGLAHDAGNLLGALGLYCDLLHAPGVLLPEHRHYATELRLLSQRSSALIRRLLLNASRDPAFADTPHGAALAANPLNDPALTLRALEPLLQRIASPHATAIVEIGDSLPSLPFPTETLERIVLNLVRNAADALHRQRSYFGDTDGIIRVALHAHGDQLRLVVEDNGPGLEMRAAAKFLHPASAPEHRYRSLGHRIVHELAQASGAGLEIRVRPAQGSTFIFHWSLNRARHARDPRHETSHTQRAKQAC